MQPYPITLEGVINNYSFWGIPASFLGGALIAISPCILPLLPITVSVIGEAALVTKAKNISISLLFVLGVTVTYVTLGISAALFGIFIGKIINAFWVNLLLGIFFVFLGISFFDIFHFSLFSFNYTPKANLISVFILGMLSGFTMIPCALPVLGAILTIISIKKNIAYGMLCLTFFSFGYGSVLMLIGESATFLRHLSERRHWFRALRRGLGVVISCMGVYFIATTLLLLV